MDARVLVLLTLTAAGTLAAPAALARPAAPSRVIVTFTGKASGYVEYKKANGGGHWRVTNLKWTLVWDIPDNPTGILYAQKPEAISGTDELVVSTKNPGECKSRTITPDEPAVMQPAGANTWKVPVPLFGAYAKGCTGPTTGLGDWEFYGASANTIADFYYAKFPLDLSNPKPYYHVYSLVWNRSPPATAIDESDVERWSGTLRVSIGS